MIKDLTASVKYIGVDDTDIDLFESQYVVPEGMSYNSYLILNRKVAVMDTVDARKGEEWLAQLETALGGRKPDYLVVHHMEPDHSGTVAALSERYPGMEIVLSAKAAAFLGQFYPGKTFPVQMVKEGDVLELGEHSLRFFAAPMVHWPEVLVSYDAADKILFSADGFGKFGALGKCGYFSDEDDDWACEARRYYFNICGKYGAPVQQLLKKASVLEIKQIAPLHGPILRNDLSEYLRLYDLWSRYEPETEGIFVAWASIHGGTAAAAKELAQMLRDKGCPKVVETDLCRCDLAEAVEDAFRYGTLVMAASSYDAGLFTPAWNFLHLLQVKTWQKRRVALIENGTWAPSAGKVMKEMFQGMKDIEIVEETLTLKSRLREQDRAALEALADSLL